MEWWGCGKIKGKQHEDYVKRAVIENSKFNTSTSDFCCVLRPGDALPCNFGVNSFLQSVISQVERFLHRIAPGEKLGP